MGRFEIHKSITGQFYSKIRAGNGETLMHSENFKNYNDALSNLKSCAKVALQVLDIPTLITGADIAIHDFTKHEHNPEKIIVSMSDEADEIDTHDPTSTVEP